MNTLFCVNLRSLDTHIFILRPLYAGLGRPGKAVLDTQQYDRL